MWGNRAGSKASVPKRETAVSATNGWTGEKRLYNFGPVSRVLCHMFCLLLVVCPCARWLQVVAELCGCTQIGNACTDTDGKITGHYTALVWPTTREVGCGKAYCFNPDPAKAATAYAVIYVCNYFPGGNGKGKYPYCYKNKPSTSKE
jgi:hypothetical protein